MVMVATLSKSQSKMSTVAPLYQLIHKFGFIGKITEADWDTSNDKPAEAC